jgi:hypothetical protein
MSKVTHPIEELEAERIEAAMQADRAAFAAALVAATEAEFGEADPRRESVNPNERPKSPPPSPLLGHVVFLACIAVGALLAAAARGTIHFAPSLGAVHERYFGHGVGMFVVLACGGLLVGIGTRMSGGCTSGHGLSGTARLVPASVVATMTFMAAAIAVSFLLAKVFS